jgi:cytochrome c biogenesis protein
MIKQIPSVIGLIFPKKDGIDDGVFVSSQIRKTIQCHRSLPCLERKAVLLLKPFGPLRAKIEKANNIYLFAEKGKCSKMGGILIHFSILFIFGGGLVGAIWGFNGQMSIVEGETGDKIVLFNGSEVKKLDFDVRCDNFKVDRYETGQPKDYRTDLTILKNGKEIISQAIRVNHPMFYDGLKFCQATYGIAGANNFQVVVRNMKSGEDSILTLNMMKKVSLPGSESSFALARFIPDYRGGGPAVLGVFLEPGKDHEIFWLFKDYRQVKGGFSFMFRDFDREYYTGLQINRDPGVPVVWIGCILILIGLVLSLFFAHARVWLRISEAEGGCEVKIAASVGKDKNSLEERLEKFAGKLRVD